MADFIGLFGEKFAEEDDNTDSTVVASSRNPRFQDCPGFLPPECADGNIEYKLKLVNPNPARFEHLVTQMKWRLREGHGEAIYELGVEDKGLLVGLTDEEARGSLATLYMMAEKLGASVTVLRERRVSLNAQDSSSPGKGFVERTALEVLVRKVPEDQESVELRVAVLGNMEVGKSTLLGVLTHGELDNGRGSARLNLFRHRHEIQTGRTSSISRELLGFSSDGQPLTYATFRSPEEVVQAASKLITFIDLAGHQKYLRTTVFGLIGHLPHLSLLLVSAVTGIVETTKEHLSLARALELPVVVVVSKTDLVPPRQLEETKVSVEDALKNLPIKRIPFRVESEDDALTAASRMREIALTPMFFVSSLTGAGIQLLYLFLNVFPARISSREWQELLQRQAEFQIDETFDVPGVGFVAGGLLMAGVVRTGDDLIVGPFEDGNFHSLKVKSIHRNRVPCRVVRAGESATLALDQSVAAIEQSSRLLRRGMVLLPPSLLESDVKQYTCVYFQARIHVLHHPTAICPGFQTTAYVGNTRQTVVVIALMGRQSLAANESSSVMLRFIRQPEFVRPGSRVLLREGTSKAVGHVVQVFPLSKQ